MTAPAVRVLPLGGLGEIGKNMTVVECDGRILVVDVGLRFPTPVPAGSRIHARSRFTQVKAVPPGTLATLEVHIHIVGNDRPSVTNTVLILYM